MKILHALCAILVLQTSVYAVEITVGSTRLTIPAPEGYAPLTSDMQPYADLDKRFVVPQNEQFALFLPNDSIAIAKAGEIPGRTRRFDVQVPRQIIEPLITKADFAELKKMLKTQTEKILKEAETQMPGIFKKMTDGLSKDSDVDMGITALQMLPMPVHSETDRSMAYSAFFNFNFDDGTGTTQPVEGVVTTTFVHLKGKVLVFYVHAEKSGLEWSKTISKTWTDQIIAQNPSDAAEAAQEAKPRFGFNWNSILRGAIIGGIAGGLAALIMPLVKKKKKKPAP